MQWQTLAPKARWLFYAQSLSRFVFFWLPAALFAGAWLVTQWTLLQTIGTVGAVLFAVLLASIWMPSLTFDRWAWARRDVDLLIAHGVFFRAITAIPTNRIQHVDVRQGPVEQSLGLARVMVFTASGMGADGVIPGLTLETAEALRDELVQTEGDDGV